MKKKTIPFILSFALALSFLSGCGNKEEEATKAENGNSGSLIDEMKTATGFPEGNTSGKTGDGKDKEDKEGNKNSEGEKEQIKWLAEPFLTVDDILVEDITKNPASQAVAVVKNDEKYGYIRYDGSYALEPFFQYSAPDFYGYYNSSEDGGAVFGTISETGELIIYSTGVGWGGPEASYYYFDVDSMNMYQEFGGVDAYRGDDVQVVDQIKSMENENSVPVTEGKYGLASKKGLITELKYEDGYCRTLNESPYAALESNGKWAFFTIDGKQLTDFSYEAIPDHFQGGECRTKLNGSYEIDSHFVPYLPTDGYIAVKQNGKYGYIDLDGKEVYPVGTFDDVRPVHGGRAWAKKDGKWGVVEFTPSKDKTVKIKAEDYFKINDTYEVLDAYSDVIEDYKKGFDHILVWDNTDGLQTTYGFTAFMDEHIGETKGKIPAYALYDINGDGTKELFLKPLSSDGYGTLYDDIFTLVNGKPVKLDIADESARLLGYGGDIRLCEEGRLLWILYERYTEHSYAEVSLFKISADGSKWEYEDGVDVSIEGWPEDPVYTYKDKDGKVTTKEAYDSMFEKYPEVELKFTQLP